MKLALVQHNPLIGDLEGNRLRLEQAVAEAKSAGADLAITSELALTGYPPRDLLLRPGFLDDCQRTLEDLAKSLALPAIIGSMHPIAGSPSAENAAFVLQGGSVRSVHAKSLLPTYDVFDEWRYFQPATSRAPAVVLGSRIGVTICEDAWHAAEPRYQDDPFEDLAQQGVDFFVNLAASPYAKSKRQKRQALLSQLAKRHNRPLVFVNQVGGNDDLVFEGGSALYTRRGTVAARAKEFESDVLLCDVDQDSDAQHGMNDTEALLAALELGTRDYVRKTGFTKVILGLSGGIDSALTAAIAVRALGSENVLGIALPSAFSSDHSLRDAEALAENLAIELQTVPIAPVVDALETQLAPPFAGRPADVTEENIQARARGVILMALSNKLGHMLLTTSNKSEIAVGYCTLYGDMCGGFAPISDVYKTEVYQLARAINETAGRDLIPASTLEKAPSAELRPGQTDQDSLPPYDVLDHLLTLSIDGRMSVNDLVAAGHDRALCVDIVTKLRRSEYKRFQAAPGIKVSEVAFGPGRRMPLAAAPVPG